MTPPPSATAHSNGRAFTRPRMVAFPNQKGGVGKTTCALCLASALAKAGSRVLMVDLDPQCSLTSTLIEGFSALEGFDGFTMFDVLTQQVKTRQAGLAVQAARESRWENVWIIPGDTQMAQFNDSRVMGCEQYLKIAFRDMTTELFDVVLFDCPGNVGPLAEMAFVVCDDCIVVSETSRYGLDGIGQLLDAVDKVSSFYNDQLRICGYLANRHEPGTLENKHRLAELREFAGDLMMEPPINSRPGVFGKVTGAAHRLDLNSTEKTERECATWFDAWARRIMKEKVAV